jgi:site-specific DNA recombinase
MSAIGYARVSTADQSDRGVSLSVQWAAIEAYCTMKGLELVERVEDAGVSGSVPLAERREGRRLAAALKEHRAAHIIALKLDRLFRDAGDALQRTKAWDKAGIALHLIDMGGSAIDTSSAIGRMMLTMLSGFAEFERTLIGERTRAALQHLKRQGRRVGQIPYGWRLAGDDAKRLEPDPAEQVVVELARQLRGSGLTLRAIGDELAARGHLSRVGRPFASAQIIRMVA